MYTGNVPAASIQPILDSGLFHDRLLQLMHLQQVDDAPLDIEFVSDYLLLQKQARTYKRQMKQHIYFIKRKPIFHFILIPCKNSFYILFKKMY